MSNHRSPAPNVKQDRPFGLPWPLFAVVAVLAALTTYQQLMLPGTLKDAQADLVTSVADRNQVATTQNTSIAQTRSLVKQLEALGYKPVVNTADIPKAVSLIAGPQGPQGLMGLPGPIGLRGPVGPQGPQGPVGPAGSYPQCLLAATKCVGGVGPSGPAGPVGPTGPAGVDGSTGAQGDPGPRGEVGPKGIQGETGAQGPQGVQGEKGEKGDAGPTCPDGSVLTRESVTTMNGPKDSYLCEVTP